MRHHLQLGRPAQVRSHRWRTPYVPSTSTRKITKTLIDGGGGLNVLSVDTFDNPQVPYEQLQPTKPFSGVTDGSTTLIGQVCLPFTFGTRDNYRTELIDFDVVHIRLPYNAILGYPALAKFMAVRCQEAEESSRSRVKRGMRCARSSVPFKLPQSTTPTVRARILLRPSPRRRSSCAVPDLRRVVSRLGPRQDQRLL